jgi:hypothetical protein
MLTKYWVSAMADIVIINPNFEMSFWGFQGGLRFLGKQANMPVGALPLLIGDRSLRKIYLRRVLTVLRKRPDGVLLKLYAIRCATHYHFHRLTRQLRAHDGSLLNTY